MKKYLPEKNKLCKFIHNRFIYEIENLITALAALKVALETIQYGERVHETIHMEDAYL